MTSNPQSPQPPPSQSPLGAVDVLRAGTIAVIESASETAHYPLINRGVLARVGVPWLTLEYFDEADLEPLLATPLHERFAAILLTPGAVALPVVRAALTRHTDALARALRAGMGIVVNATTLGGHPRFDLTFLPEGGQISLVETGMRAMTGVLRVDGVGERVITEPEGQVLRSAVTVAASQAFGWDAAATLTGTGRGAAGGLAMLGRRRSGAASGETVAWRAQFGRGRVIVSVLPFEWLNWDDVVQRSLTRATRARGTLIVGQEDPPDWYDDVNGGQFLARLTDPAQGDLLDDLLGMFAHVRLCRDAAWSRVPALTREALLARLENDGTVEFAAPGPAEDVYARMHGVPRYLARLRVAQEQLLGSIDQVHAGPTFHVLALALLCRTAGEVVRDELFIPDLLRLEAARAVTEATVARRMREGNVDGLLLPTVNLLAACAITDTDPEAQAAMLGWVRANAFSALPDSRAQARWAARAADRPDLLALIPAPNLPPDSVLGRLSFELDGGALGSGSGSGSGTGSGVGGLGSLDAAIHAYTYARWGDRAVAGDVVAQLLAGGGQRSTSVHNVEELCYRTAAQALLDATAPLTVHPTEAAVPDQVPRAASELLARQAEAELSARSSERATQELAMVLRAARMMSGVFAAVIGAGLVALVLLPLWWPGLRRVGLDVRLTLVAGAFVIATSLATVLLRSAVVQRVAPRWVLALGGWVRSVRSG